VLDTAFEEFLKLEGGEREKRGKRERDGPPSD